MRNFFWGLVCLVLMATVGITSAAAQVPSGSIVGSVTDPAGSSLVSARITADPSGRQAVSDNQGSFRLQNLPAGSYTLTTSYVGFASTTTTVTVVAGQTATAAVVLKVASEADSIMVTADRLQGDAEAINIERMSADIVQVLPEGTITSLPNTNVADAVGRLPSVSLERDEGEGKYVQIRGTEPRLNNVTINGVNVPAPEVTVRNIKLDVIPSGVVERLEIYKTLSADLDADGIGGNVNLVTKSAVEKPTYSLSTTVGYNPLQEGFWRGGFDATAGQRFGANKKFGVLLGGTYDKTNRGIDDLEPSQSIGSLDGGVTNFAYVSSVDYRSYDYYRSRYGFDSGVDWKVTPTMTVYGKGLYADFHDYGDTNVYTPNAGSPVAANGSTITFDNTGSWQARHYVRRPDQQVYSFLLGGRHDLRKDVVIYEFAVSRGHNIGGQDFPTTNFNGNGAVPFTQSLANPYRPKFTATDGTNGFDASQYGVVFTDYTYYHATQVNVQGDASIAHDYQVHGSPSTFSMGVKFRNSHSTQNENDHRYDVGATTPFTLADVVGNYKNPTYYDKSFAIGGQAYGPTSDYNKIVKAFQANQGAFVYNAVDSVTRSQQAFFNADERVSAGYIEDVIFLKKLRLQGGVRFEGTGTHFFTQTVTAQYDSNGNPVLPSLAPNRQDSGYVTVLPSVQAQYQLQTNTNLRVVYGRGQSRPNIGDLVPTTTIDPNASPKSISKGNPDLLPTKANNYDILIEHYFQPLGVVQAGFFYKQLYDPIYPTTVQVTLQGELYQQNESINGPSAHIQGVELNYEQRFSFLPGLLNGLGVAANYSRTASGVKFPADYNLGRTDNAPLQRQAPNNYNFNLTYDKSRFSSRFAISHNDASIAAYQWSPGTGPANDPILGLKGPSGDNYFYAHTQFDVQGSYRVIKGVEFVASGLNLSNEVFGFYNGSTIYPVQREYYRPTYSFGLRWASGRE